MRKLGIEITRESYIAFNWTDSPPEDWGAEDETQMPMKLRIGYDEDEDDC
jgi:hypothetical protein